MSFILRMRETAMCLRWVHHSCHSQGGVVVHVYTGVACAYIQVVTAVFQYMKMLQGASTAQLERCANISTCLHTPHTCLTSCYAALCLQSFVCEFKACLWVLCVTGYPLITPPPAGCIRRWGLLKRMNLTSRRRLVTLLLVLYMCMLAVFVPIPVVCMHTRTHTHTHTYTHTHTHTDTHTHTHTHTQWFTWSCEMTDWHIPIFSLV